jgi:hypothetical protein
MKELPRYIYRGLRHEEIDAGYILIPKAQRPFLAHPRLPINLPHILGQRVEHAVREHQWESQYETSGISTTPHFHRAVHYARHKIVVKIDASLFGAHGILTHSVTDYVDEAFICVPEDEEIILVCKNGYVFPKEIIAEITRLD